MQGPQCLSWSSTLERGRPFPKQTEDLHSQNYKDLKKKNKKNPHTLRINKTFFFFSSHPSSHHFRFLHWANTELNMKCIFSDIYISALFTSILCICIHLCVLVYTTTQRFLESERENFAYSVNCSSIPFFFFNLALSLGDFSVSVCSNSF